MGGGALAGLILGGGKDVMGAAGGGDPCPDALARARRRPSGAEVKRFWDTVTLTLDDVGEHRILLDGKPINLPNGGVLRVGPPALAEAIAEEWRLAGGGERRRHELRRYAADPHRRHRAGTDRARSGADGRCDRALWRDRSAVLPGRDPARTRGPAGAVTGSPGSIGPR